MALAMLRGYKRIESRKGRRLPAGWYCLHVGQKSLRGQPPECSQALQRVWPDAPSEDALPTSCVVGMVCLGKVLQCQLVDDPWKCESLPLVHVIDATLEFLQPVLQVRGQQGVWYITDTKVRERVQQARLDAAVVCHPVIYPDAACMRKAAAASSARKPFQPWAKKLPRKRRTDAGVARGPPGLAMPPSKRRRLMLREAVPRTGLAKNPAAPAEQAHTPRGVDSLGLAQRVAAGRTLPRLLTLMQFHFLRPVHDSPAALPLRPGLFATLSSSGQAVFILGTFARRSSALVDVVPLRAATFQGQNVYKAFYKELQTCRQAELADVGMHYVTASCSNDRRGSCSLPALCM